MCALLAVLRRRNTEYRTEGARERLQTAIARALGNLSDRHRAIREVSGRTMQPQATHGRRHSLAVHRLVDSMPVIRRQTGDVRQTVDIQRFVEMVVNMVEHAAQPSFVA